MASKARNADTIKEMAKNRYDRSQADYEQANKRCIAQMERMDDLKLEIWEGFDHFLNTFEKIKNRPELTGEVQKEKIQLTAVELEELKMQTSKLKDATVAVTGAMVGASTAGVTATAVLSGIGFSAFTVMGVGEAIATTASFASVNIALYGAGAVFWPAAVIAAAATAVGAIFSHAHGNRKIEEAHEIERQVDKAYISFKKAREYLNRLENCARNVCQSMESIFIFYQEQMSRFANKRR